MAMIGACVLLLEVVDHLHLMCLYLQESKMHQRLHKFLNLVFFRLRDETNERGEPMVPEDSIRTERRTEVFLD